MSPSDRLVISGGAATGNTSVHVTKVGGPGALTSANGIQVVGAASGATTSPGAFSSRIGIARGRFRLRLFRGGLGSAARRIGSCARNWSRRPAVVAAVACLFSDPAIPTIDPPPNPLPPSVEFPIIGPELATYGVVQPLARQLGLSILGTLDDRVGDTYEPDGCAVAPAAPPNALPTRKTEAGAAPCPLFRPRSGAAFSAKRSTTTNAAFADPRASGNLGASRAASIFCGDL